MSDTAATADPQVQRRNMRTFTQVLINTAVANVTTSFLWFGLTFWAYIETQSVLATGIIGGTYMLFVAFFGILFGSIVDRHRKHRVMVLSSTVTLGSFLIAGAVYLAAPAGDLSDLGQPWFWFFAGIILFGSVVENLRNIALSTTVTLLVPEERHANANGLVGTVQGLAFIVTSVFSGLAIGFVGMGGTLLIALVLTALAFLHLTIVRIDEGKREFAAGAQPPTFDLRGSIAAVTAVPALFALIVFSTFNNLIGGVYMSLMDPYGLTLFPVQIWGIVLGVTATGFIVGGLVVAKFGLGRNPIRTMLILVIVMGAIGSLFTIREWWWLYAVGIFLYLCLIPAIEAAEQTVIQKVVPYERQGRVFGFAQAFEAAAAPITAFAIAPIAQFGIIPLLRSQEGQDIWGWLLGDGEVRGIALIFFFAGIIMILITLGAFASRSYRTLSRGYMGDAEARSGALDAAKS